MYRQLYLYEEANAHNVFPYFEEKQWYCDWIKLIFTTMLLFVLSGVKSSFSF